MANTGKIKVLGFDGWTMGSHHYVRLLDAFKENEIELLLIHLGSWGDEPGRSKEEFIHGLKVRDISFYRDQDFPALLDLERPDVVLFLSTETFLHRAFQRYCFARSVPTIHLFHGLLGVLPVAPGEKLFKISLIGHLVYAFERAKKFLRRTLFVYALSLLRTSARLGEWIRFIHEVYFRAIGKMIITPALDSRSTRCCVYTQADLKAIAVKWDYAASEALAVGNPDLLTFDIADELMGIGVRRNESDVTNCVVYIETGLSSHGYYFGSDEEYLEFLVQCARAVAEQGYSLRVKVKPHPVSRHAFFSAALARNNIETLENAEFSSVLSRAKACIIEPSTLALIPCLMGLPVFLSCAGPLGTLRYGDLFVGYPRAICLTNWEDLSRGISIEISPDLAAGTLGWIMENTGPLPANDMPERVSSVVLELSQKKWQS